MADDVPLRLLIVEDNLADVRLLQETLTEARHSRFFLVHASGVAEALQRIQDERFDLVLLDLGLPDAHGLESLERIRPYAVDLPIVVLTGFDDEATAIRAVQNGAQDYLIKGSIDPMLLARAIRHAVERHRLLKRIEEQAAMLERNRSRAQLVGMVAHELRNPMAVSKAILTLLRSQASSGQPPQRLASKLAIAEQEIDRVAWLLNEVLHAFEVEQDMLNLALKPINIVSLVASVVAPFDLAHPRHRMIQERGSEEVWIEGDQDRLERVLRHLVENAVKFSPQGGEIVVRTGIEGAYATLSVADQGIGIPPECLGRVFEGFFRTSDAVEQDMEGLGLGLFISRAVIEAHGGRLWAENNPQRGATFHVEIPLRGRRQDLESD